MQISLEISIASDCGCGPNCFEMKKSAAANGVCYHHKVHLWINQQDDMKGVMSDYENDM